MILSDIHCAKQQHSMTSAVAAKKQRQSNDTQTHSFRAIRSGIDAGSPACASFPHEPPETHLSAQRGTTFNLRRAAAVFLRNLRRTTGTLQHNAPPGPERSVSGSIQRADLPANCAQSPEGHDLPAHGPVPTQQRCRCRRQHSRSLRSWRILSFLSQLERSSIDEASPAVPPWSGHCGKSSQ